MKRLTRATTILLILQLVLSLAAKGQTGKPQLTAKGQAAPAQNAAVNGGGTPGRLAKWAGVSGSSSFVLGDSYIFEDKFGKVGINTLTPTSPLTVAGMIETTLGGYKFPDGTVQTTAFSPSQMVRSLNGLQGDLNLAAGANITITPSNGNTLTIAAPNLLTAVAHNATLSGNGTAASPLGIAVPLEISGVAGNQQISVVKITSLSKDSRGLTVEGGHSMDLSGGNSLYALGGNTKNGVAGGAALLAYGGSTQSANSQGGDGLFSVGGAALNSGIGGVGIQTRGGDAEGMGGQGGYGILVFAGLGSDGATHGIAGKFYGDVEVGGNFNVIAGGTKNFKIDHPLDPENKYLYHAAIESSEVLNVYSGNVTTDDNGEAVVTLPEWFETINKDFRYQLTVLGTFAQAIVADEVKNNHFKIRTTAAGVKVSWQVTGVRSDAAILKHPFKLEESKRPSERGYYLTPDAYSQPEERGIEWARNPQRMQQLKEQRIEAEQKRRLQ